MVYPLELLLMHSPRIGFVLSAVRIKTASLRSSSRSGLDGVKQDSGTYCVKL